LNGYLKKKDYNDHIQLETLKTLHKENRIVGLISHVEEMQQEIDNYVKVNNTSEHGSIIKCSWEN